MEDEQIEKEPELEDEIENQTNEMRSQNVIICNNSTVESDEKIPKTIQDVSSENIQITVTEEVDGDDVTGVVLEQGE